MKPANYMKALAQASVTEGWKIELAAIEKAAIAAAAEGRFGVEWKIKYSMTRPKLVELGYTILESQYFNIPETISWN